MWRNSQGARLRGTLWVKLEESRKPDFGTDWGWERLEAALGLWFKGSEVRPRVGGWRHRRVAEGAPMWV